MLNAATVRLARILTPVALVLFAAPPSAFAEEADVAKTPDWRDSWEIQEDFVIERIATGFSFPVAMAFVPEPGRGAKDPLYFVLEIRGNLKVVTNDGTIQTFATGLTDYVPRLELPAESGEGGSAGLCLEPDNGYIFVTFMYQTANKNLQNAMVRLAALPKTFGLEEKGDRFRIDAPFDGSPSAISHQVGPCRVHDGLIYVSVGDGEVPRFARDPLFANGKILRMTFDGKPAPQNPFYERNAKVITPSYIFSTGLRNPFGLEVRRGRVFVADNGPYVDRFLIAEAGEDYLYDGTDASIGVRGVMTIYPAVSPVGFDLHPDDGPFPDSYDDTFFVTLSGSPADPPGPGVNGDRSLVLFRFDFEKDRVKEVPTPFLRYRGTGVQLPVDAKFGPGGLYVVMLMPSVDGATSIMRIRHAPDEEYPNRLSDMARFYANPELLMAAYSCNSCHSFAPDWPGPGPTLDPTMLDKRLRARLLLPKYTLELDELDAAASPDEEEDQDRKRRRAAVRAVEGRERLETWTLHHLLDPKFDNPFSQMPQMGLTEEEAKILVGFLLNLPPPPPPPSLKLRVGNVFRSSIGKAKHSHLPIAFVLGGVAGVAFMWLARRFRRR